MRGSEYIYFSSFFSFSLSLLSFFSSLSQRLDIYIIFSLVTGVCKCYSFSLSAFLSLVELSFSIVRRSPLFLSNSCLTGIAPNQRIEQEKEKPSSSSSSFFLCAVLVYDWCSGTDLSFSLFTGRSEQKRLIKVRINPFLFLPLDVIGSPSNRTVN